MCYAVSTEVELAATKPKGEIMKMKKTKYCLIEKNKHIFFSLSLYLIYKPIEN